MRGGRRSPLGESIECPVCGQAVRLYFARGSIVEHAKPRTGPVPEGCEASNRTPRSAERLARAAIEGETP